MAEFSSIGALVTAAQRLGIQTAGRSRDEIAADYGRRTGQGVVCNFTAASAQARTYTNPRKKGN